MRLTNTEEPFEYVNVDGAIYARRDVVTDRLMPGFVKRLLEKGVIKIVEGQEDFFKTHNGVPTDLFNEFLMK